MSIIKFGTDGWRAIIGKEYTIENVCRVAEATGKWILKNGGNKKVVVGHDTRFGGKMFAEATCNVLCAMGIKCYLANGFVSTPMVSLGTVKHGAALGIVITASHNPSSYNGFKLKGHFGGPLQPEKIEEIEKLIPDFASTIDEHAMSEYRSQGLLVETDLETMYCKHVDENFDLELINNSGIRIAYDAMFGAGQSVVRRLLPNAALLHCDENPSFGGTAPEPIHKNLGQLSSYIKNDGKINLGFATDGDADRIGLYDERGNFIDSHHVILLLIKYLAETKNLKGKVVTAFSVTPKVSKMCSHFSIEQQVTKVGFKYIASIMATEDVLLGGEESGGIAVKGHIPERDGVWIGLTMLECMAKSGKSLSELIDEVYEIVGTFAFERSDLHLDEEVKKKIVANCEKNIYSNFGEYKIQRIENTDGYKYFFNDDEWFMVRISGTEPVLRNYAESSSKQHALGILKAAESTFLQNQVQ